MARSQTRLWRSTTGHRRRWASIVVAFALMCLIGLVMVGVILWVSTVIGLPSVPTWAVWLALSVAVLPVAMSARTPALIEGDQPWTEFVVRAVMIGEQTPRPRWWRVATVFAFGPALVGYAIVYAVQMLLGLV